MDKTGLFQAFNAIRSLVRAGKLNTNMARVNQALGIVQSHEPSPYVSTPDDCSCPDRVNRQVVCKHMIVAAFRQIMDDRRESEHRSSVQKRKKNAR